MLSFAMIPLPAGVLGSRACSCTLTLRRRLYTYLLVPLYQYPGTVSYCIRRALSSKHSINKRVKAKRRLHK